ncbi:MAG: GTP-binding protein [Promethearchaeota archaeon]|nr:MAG: GTP-binding protein [Candidatus Lokiarchaeota archaeon]
MQDLLFKVCIFGDGGVGKTSLVRRFLTGLFVGNTTITLGVEFHMKKLDILGKRVTLQIWDFAGEDRFRFLLPGYVKGSSGGIFMFDITRGASLRNFDDWLTIFTKGTEDSPIENPPIIMVGGKLDLHDRRAVYSKDAVDLAKKYDILDYIECSAKTGENVELIFHKLALALTKRVENM